MTVEWIKDEDLPDEMLAQMEKAASKAPECEGISVPCAITVRLCDDETIRKITELGEPEVFKAYRQKWDAAAAVIVPMMREAQRANGIEPYTPEQYERAP